MSKVRRMSSLGRFWWIALLSYLPTSTAFSLGPSWVSLPTQSSTSISSHTVTSSPLSSDTTVSTTLKSPKKRLPKLGSDGLYHIFNEAQHSAFLEANADKLIAIKFFAPWCRACKALEPKFLAIAHDRAYADIPIVWADLTILHNKDLAKKLGVLALPSIHLYAYGQLVDNFPCGPSRVPMLKKRLARLIDQTAQFRNATVTPTVPDFRKGPLIRRHRHVEVPRPDTTILSPPSEQTLEEILQQHKSQLRANRYFAEISESEFTTTLSKASLIDFERGHVIMREGNPGRTYYFIVSGEVETCQKTSLEDPLTTPPTYLGTVLNRFEPGDFFGERALITGEPRAASIRASIPTRVVAFDKDVFPASCVLSGQTNGDSQHIQQERQSLQDKYGEALRGILSTMNDGLYEKANLANQIRGSIYSPQDVEVDKTLDEPEDPMWTEWPPPALGTEAQTIVPLLLRFKLIRLVARCFDYVLVHRPLFGDEGSRRRRMMLVNLLPVPQRAEIHKAFQLVHGTGRGETTLVEMKKLMDSISEDSSSSDSDLFDIHWQNEMEHGDQPITYEDFTGLMAEVELYDLLLETFRSLDKRDSGFVRAKDLDRVLCGIRDLVTDDRRSIIDVEDTEMMVDYEQFSKLLLGTALN